MSRSARLRQRTPAKRKANRGVKPEIRDVAVRHVQRKRTPKVARSAQAHAHA